MSETSVVFNLLVKDNASLAFNELRLQASKAFDAIASKAFDFAKQSVEAFEASERADLLLQDAFAKFPKLADTNIDKLKKMGEQIMAVTKFDHESVQAGQAKLAMFNFTGKQIEALTPLMADFAAKTGGDLVSAAAVFGKAMIGQGRGLKAVGINFKDTGSAAGNYAQLLDGLRDKVGGFAVKEGKTFSNQMIILKNQYDELKETVGSALVPVLQKLIPTLRQTVDFFQRNSNVMMKVLTVVGSLIGIIWALNAAVRAYTTVQIAMNIAMHANPIGLIILAVIALVGGIYLLWTHSAGFRNFFIGMWTHIWGFLKAVGAWFSGPFAGFFVHGFNVVWGFLKAVGAWFAGPFVNFFVQAGRIIGDVAHAIASPFVWLWQHVIYPGFATTSQIVRSFINLFVWLGVQVVKPILDGIGLAIQTVGAIFRWVYETIFTPFGQGVMWVLTQIGNAASWLYTTILVPFGAGVEFVIQKVGAGWNWLWSNAIGPAINLITSSITWWWGILVGAFDIIMAKVHEVGSTFQMVFSAIGGFISGAFTGAVALVKNVINGLIGVINSAINGINANVIDLANRVPGVNFPHIRNVPRLDVGGFIEATGLAVVHKGESIIPAGRAGGGAVTVTFDFRGIDSDMARALRKMVRVEGGGNVQVALGH